MDEQDDQRTRPMTASFPASETSRGTANGGWADTQMPGDERIPDTQAIPTTQAMPAAQPVQPIQPVQPAPTQRVVYGDTRRTAGDTSAQQAAQYPTEQYSAEQFATAQYQTPQYGDTPQYTQYGGESNQYPPCQGDSGNPRKHHKRWPIVVAIIAVIAIAAGAVGIYVYHDRHEQALAACRDAVSSFSEARKELLDTGGSSSQVQKLLREVLGVDGILDAAADASSKAEQTVGSEGCAANATITQLNLVKDTLNSATASLRESVAKIKKDATKLEQDGSSSNNDGSSGSDSSGNDSTNGGTSTDGNDSSNSDTLEQRKQELQNTIDSARGLLDQLKNSETTNTLKQLAGNALEQAIDGAQKLADNPDIKNSQTLEAAKNALAQAIDTAQQWFSEQTDGQ